MTLEQRLTDDMKAALKAGEKERLGIIRLLLNEVKNADLAPGKPTPEAQVEAYGKKLRKTIGEYADYGHPERADALQRELAIVETYLPKKKSAEETEALVDAFLDGKAFTPQQIGQATGAFMKAHGKEVEASVASAILKRRLQPPV